jgi:hypothetical protein
VRPKVFNSSAVMRDNTNQGTIEVYDSDASILEGVNEGTIIAHGAPGRTVTIRGTNGPTGVVTVLGGHADVECENYGVIDFQGAVTGRIVVTGNRVTGAVDTPGLDLVYPPAAPPAAPYQVVLLVELAADEQATEPAASNFEPANGFPASGRVHLFASLAEHTGRTIEYGGVSHSLPDHVATLWTAADITDGAPGVPLALDASQLLTPASARNLVLRPCGLEASHTYRFTLTVSPCDAAAAARGECASPFADAAAFSSWAALPPVAATIDVRTRTAPTTGTFCVNGACDGDGAIIAAEPKMRQAVDGELWRDAGVALTSDFEMRAQHWDSPYAADGRQSLLTYAFAYLPNSGGAAVPRGGCVPGYAGLTPVSGTTPLGGMTPRSVVALGRTLPAGNHTLTLGVTTQWGASTCACPAVALQALRAHTMPCCAMLCRAVLCCAVLCRAVPCCAVLCCAVLCCAAMLCGSCSAALQVLPMLWHAVLCCRCCPCSWTRRSQARRSALPPRSPPRATRRAPPRTPRR